MKNQSAQQVESYKNAYPRNSNGPKVNLDRVHFPLKLLAQEKQIRQFVSGRRVHPIHARIGITSGCNLRCNFCNFHAPNEQSFYDAFSYDDKLDTRDAIQFLKEFRNNGGWAVTFCGSGECTIHPGYPEICRAAAEFGLKTGLITNGTMLHNRAVAESIAQTHTWVRIGMNAGNAESFARITRYKPEAFMQIFNSIRYFRDNAVEKDFVIGVNVVITKENYGEMYDAARLAKEAGAGYIRFEPEYYTSLGHAPIEGILNGIEEALRRARDLATDTFEVSIPKMDRGAMVDNDTTEGDFRSCHYSSFCTALGADGYMYPCPQVHLGSRYRMGKAIGRGYTSWLKSGEREEWIRKNSDRAGLCKTCFYRPQNEILEWLLTGRLDVEKTLEEYRKDNPVTVHSLFI